MSRDPASRDKLRELMKAIGAAAKTPGAVYLTGGGTALLLGWRETTVDVDLKLDPEPDGVFEAIPKIKDRLHLNIELASPDHFIPPRLDWRAKSTFIAKYGLVDFYHFDLVSQALSKIERGHTRDLADVRAMIERHLVRPKELRDGFTEIEPRLLRYPSIDADVFREKVEDFLREVSASDE